MAAFLEQRDRLHHHARTEAHAALGRLDRLLLPVRSPRDERARSRLDVRTAKREDLAAAKPRVRALEKRDEHVRSLAAAARGSCRRPGVRRSWLRESTFLRGVQARRICELEGVAVDGRGIDGELDEVPSDEDRCRALNSSVTAARREERRAAGDHALARRGRRHSPSAPRSTYSSASPAATASSSSTAPSTRLPRPAPLIRASRGSATLTRRATRARGRPRAPGRARRRPVRSRSRRRARRR